MTAGADPDGAGPLIPSAAPGRASESVRRGRRHAAEREGRLETVRIAPEDAARRRMRRRADRGRDVALAPPLDETGSDGAAPRRSDSLAVLAWIDAGPRLRLTPASVADGLRLGHFSGNPHWKARFHGGAPEVVMDGPGKGCRARLRDPAALCAFAVVRREPRA